MTLSKNESDAIAPAIRQIEQLREQMLFNINHHVWVQLSKTGRKIHLDEHIKSASPYSYEAPKEIEGWSRWQLWHLMEMFGPHIYNGAELPFETTIKIETK